MRAFVLCAGLGTRLRPITGCVPKALMPYLNVALLDRRLRALAAEGLQEAAVNLHHEGGRIVEHVGEAPVPGVAVRFFWEPEILGTGGALKNAESFFESGDVLVWNVDAELVPDLPRLSAAHRVFGGELTLLAARNPDPTRFTPLGVEGGRLVSVGEPVADPWLFTGVSIVSDAAVARLPPGASSVVEALWRPVLAERRPIAVVPHEGAFFDLGTPADLLEASLLALEMRQDFQPSEGVFDFERKILSAQPLEAALEVSWSVMGRVRVGAARVSRSVLLDGADVAAAREISGCIVGPGAIPEGSVFHDSLLWPGESGLRALPIHGRHWRSPAV